MVTNGNPWPRKSFAASKASCRVSLTTFKSLPVPRLGLDDEHWFHPQFAVPSIKNSPRLRFCPASTKGTAWAPTRCAEDVTLAQQQGFEIGTLARLSSLLNVSQGTKSALARDGVYARWGA